MKTSTLLKWVTGGFEILLGIPFIGAMIIIFSGWSALGIMLVLHIVTLVFSIRENERSHGSILGIITSVVGFVPFVGMVMHIITGIVLLVDAFRSS